MLSEAENFLIRHGQNQVNSEIDGEVVLMNIDKGRYYVFSEVEIDIWRHIEDGIDFRSLCDRLARVYNAEISVIEADVRGFLGDLAEQDLIEVEAMDGVNTEVGA